VSISQTIKNILNQQGVFVLLVLVLVLLFSFSFFGEKIPINDGAGYDGAFYYSVAQNFSTDFFENAYDRFRIFRIFPFFLINLFFSIFSIEPSHANLMRSMYVLHYVNLAVQLTFFFKLARLNNWKKTTTSIIFACFFFNYFTLKNCGYEIFQTDAFATTIFLVSFYYLLREKFFLALSISFLGLVTWPTVSYTIWLLYIFNKPFPQDGLRLNFITGKLVSIVFPLLSIGAVAMLYVLHKQAILESMLCMQAYLPFLITNACAWSIFLYILFRHSNYNIYCPYKKNLSIPWKKIISIAIPFLAINIFLRMQANSEFFFNEAAFTLQILLRPLKFPLITPIGHISAFGILPLLAFILFRHLLKDVFNRTVGYTFAFFAFLFFATDSEARHILPQIPLVLVPLASVLDKINLNVKSAVALIVLQLVLSHFYIPINTDGFAEALESNNFNTVAQRYFMSFGPWMAFHTYIVWAAIYVFTAILVSRIIKKRKI
jgi:hypothetical protein